MMNIRRLTVGAALMAGFGISGCEVHQVDTPDAVIADIAADIAADMSETADDIAETAADMSETADDIAETADDIAETTDDIAETTDDIAETTGDAADTADDAEATDSDADSVSSDAAADTAEPTDPTTPGAAAPVYSLMDFQPESAAFETSYGLEAFKGKVTLVAFLAGWCSYCQAVSGKLESMSKELELDGLDVNWVIVNEASSLAVSNQGKFIALTELPLLQDVKMPASDLGTAWTAHGASKDDIAIYSSDQKLVVFYNNAINPTQEAGYAELKKAMEDAVLAETP